MFRSIVTLNLPSAIITELHKKGFFYVEDLLSNPAQLNKFNLTKAEIEKELELSEILALDAWQNETEQESISLRCTELEALFNNGIQCGKVTELSGAPFTGKTQICMQLCISVQLNKHYGGLNGRAIYIDTRSGITALRFTDLVKGYNNYYKDLKLEVDDVLKNIQLWSPQSIEELLEMVNCLNDEVHKIRNDKQVRLIIIDSLSMSILCCIDDPLRRPQYYSRILRKIHKLAVSNKLPVVITNELVMQVDKNGKAFCTAAGGQYVADYAFIKLELMRLTNNKFAARLVKSPMMPEISVTFMITEDGITNVS